MKMNWNKISAFFLAFALICSSSGCNFTRDVKSDVVIKDYETISSEVIKSVKEEIDIPDSSNSVVSNESSAPKKMLLKKRRMENSYFKFLSMKTALENLHGRRLLIIMKN